MSVDLLLFDVLESSIGGHQSISYSVKRDIWGILVIGFKLFDKRVERGDCFP